LLRVKRLTLEEFCSFINSEFEADNEHDEISSAGQRSEKLKKRLLRDKVIS
jgi:hypothetical protein